MPKIFNPSPDVVTRCDRPCTVIIYLVTCKKEVSRSNGDTNEVSANDILLLKLVVVLVSKQRDRVLVKKDYPYLSGLANSVFIDVPWRAQEFSGPIGLNSECPRWVNMFLVYMHCTPNGLIPRVRGLVSGDIRAG